MNMSNITNGIIRSKLPLVAVYANILLQILTESVLNKLNAGTHGTTESQF